MHKLRSPNTLASVILPCTSIQSPQTAQGFSCCSLFCRVYLRARNAQRCQDRIGWFQLLMGFMSKSWLPIQQDYLERHNSKINARRWATQLIKKLMQIAWDMWGDRNDAKHNDRPSVMVRYDLSLNTEIDEILNKDPPYLLPADRHLLQIPANTLYAYSTIFKELWLKSVRGARETFLIHTHRISHGTRLQQQLMANWLQTASLDHSVRGADPAVAHK